MFALSSETSASNAPLAPAWTDRRGVSSVSPGSAVGQYSKYTSVPSGPAVPSPLSVAEVRPMSVANSV